MDIAYLYLVFLTAVFVVFAIAFHSGRERGEFGERAHLYAPGAFVAGFFATEGLFADLDALHELLGTVAFADGILVVMTLVMAWAWPGL